MLDGIGVVGCERLIAFHGKSLFGEDKRLSCGRVKGPPIRAVLVLTGALVTVLLAFGPLGDVPVRTRYAAAMIAALITMACSWIGHSSVPGANIYLKEA